MAYNNGFPMNYPQIYYPQPVQQMPQQNQQPSPGIIWVQGEAGAKSYLVAPNSAVTLWDSETQTIYLKSADASGMPSIKILDYTIRDGGQSEKKEKRDYATKEEVDVIRQDLIRFRARYEDLLAKEDIK